MKNSRGLVFMEIFSKWEETGVNSSLNEKRKGEKNEKNPSVIRNYGFIVIDIGSQLAKR